MAPPLHRFRVGERVEFARGGSQPAAPAGAFTILRLLPNDGADREVRLKASHDGQERVARESELRSLPTFPPGS